MDRRVTIENHFEQKDFSYELNEEREYKKYGMYFYNTKIFYSCAWSDYFSGNSFFEILANFAGVQDLNEDNYDILDKINDTLNRYIDTNNFHSDAYNYLAWEDDPLDLDFEKWAKLLVRDLYNYDIVSPFKYYKFTWDQGVGVMPFHFRGQNIKAALKSFAYNHRRNTPHINVKANYKTFISDFYNFSTRILGLNANPLGINADNFFYNADRFLRESGFFEDTNPQEVFQESNYYKRRELVV